MSPRVLCSCPICQLPVSPDFRPFCSKHCSDLDLVRWLSGAYAIAAEDDDPVVSTDEDDLTAF